MATIPVPGLEGDPVVPLQLAMLSDKARKETSVNIRRQLVLFPWMVETEFERSVRAEAVIRSSAPDL